LQAFDGELATHLGLDALALDDGAFEREVAAAV
jgi:hypothetical protein